MRRRECKSCGQRFTTTERLTAVDGKAMSTVRHNRFNRDHPGRKEDNRRYELRRNARREAAETGEPVQVIYERWGVS